MEELERIAIEPSLLFFKFIRDVKSIADDQILQNGEKRGKAYHLRNTLLLEARERFKEVMQRLEREEEELQRQLTPYKPSPYEEIMSAIAQLTNMIKKNALREELNHQWQEISAANILADYQKALDRGDMDRIEIFESYAEIVLLKKNEPSILENFRELKEKTREKRLTPAQKEARERIERIRKVKDEYNMWGEILSPTADATLRHYGVEP